MKTKKILRSIAAAVVLSALSFSLFSCNIHRYEKPEADVPGANTVLAGGMQVGEIKASGIQLLSTTVEPTAANVEKSVEITATIEPTDVVNQGVSWSVAWTNPESTWASGKSVSDYVILTPGADTKTVTVSCLQAFGEQITLTGTSQDNPEITATCALEYAQKAFLSSFNIGTLTPVDGQNCINIIFEIARGVSGPGGVLEVAIEKTNTYTVVSDFEITVTYEHDINFGYGVYQYQGSILGEFSENKNNCLGQSLYFDYEHEMCNWGYDGGGPLENMTTFEIAGILDAIPSSEYSHIGIMNIQITSDNYSISYSYDLIYSGYTNSTPITALNLNKNSFIF